MVGHDRKYWVAALPNLQNITILQYYNVTILQYWEAEREKVRHRGIGDESRARAL